MLPMLMVTHCAALWFQCSYVVDIDVHIPWAPDIEVRQPLIITPGKNNQVRLTLCSYFLK